MSHIDTKSVKSTYGIKGSTIDTDKIISWVEECTDEEIDHDNWQEDLKSGVILCKLINTIEPGKIKKINKSHIKFMQIENVSKFSKSCRDLGVKQQDAMSTSDLYNGNNLNQVLICIESLGRACQEIEGYDGPVLGKKMSKKNVRDKSNFKKGPVLTKLELDQQKVAKKNVKFDRVLHNVVKNEDEEKNLYNKKFDD